MIEMPHSHLCFRQINIDLPLLNMRTGRCDIGMGWGDVGLRRIERRTRRCDVGLALAVMRMRRGDVGLRLGYFGVRHFDVEMRHFNIEMRHFDVCFPVVQTVFSEVHVVAVNTIAGEQHGDVVLRDFMI